MAKRLHLLLRAAAGGLVAVGVAPSLPGGDLGRLVEGLAAPFKTLHRARPETCPDEAVERLGAEVDWLQRQIDLHGSIVAKAPDVWGQGRLVRHRHEIEEQLRLELPRFAETSQAAIRRSDQSFLGMALALQAVSGRRAGPALVPVPEAGGTAVASVQAMLPTTNEPIGRTDPVVIARTPPFAAAPAGLPFATEPLSVEPTLHLDHLSRYLSHLAELRRINEGDDSADSPGYSLNLVRIPVSLTPGARTRRGHGAEITITADTSLGDDLLPATFRDLVTNDLVDLVGPALVHCVNDPDCVAWSETILAAPQLAASAADRAGVAAAMQSLAARLPAITPSTAPSTKTRRARMPIPVSQLADVGGIRQIAVLVRATREALGSHPAARPCIDYVDVRGFLAEELEAAHDLLALEPQRGLWAQLPGWRLVDLVRGRRSEELARIRCHVLATIGAGGSDGDGVGLGAGDGAEPLPPVAGAWPAAECCEDRPSGEPACRSAAAALAWGILVESALLNERLAEDMREAGGGVGAACAGPFHGPDPSPEARAAFNDHVRRRWPVRVFALDPDIDEQTVEEAFARRRELQIATALAFASGRLDAQALARYTRRVETDIAAVGLNRTAVGFTHGERTFGWRFMPRVQSPPSRGHLAALGETLCGPSADADLAGRGIEPGIRECAAIVVMPSFVPRIVLDVETRWFSLVHPHDSEPGLRQSLKLSRSVKAIERSAAALIGRGCGDRDGQVARLMRKAEQLEARLPQQVLEARIPHENTSGGFELFATGVTDLAPELVGWYGAPGIDPVAATSLFLVGRGFSVHDTRVIAGGRPVRFTLLSREVMQVEIPPGVRPIGGDGCGGVVPTAFAGPAGGAAVAAAGDGGVEPLPAPPGQVGTGYRAGCHGRAFVDVHLATPYGVTSHLLVPVARRATGDAAGCGLAFEDAGPLRLSFTVAKTAGSRAESARVDEFYAADADRIVIRAPGVFVPPPRAALQLVLRDDSTGATAATLSFDPLAFDPRQSAYVIAGGDLRNLVGDTSRPATDKTLRGAVKPWLDAVLARGDLPDDGAVLPLSLSAVLVADGLRIPVAGAIPVTATRRGRTVVEPAPAAAP